MLEILNQAFGSEKTFFLLGGLTLYSLFSIVYFNAPEIVREHIITKIISSAFTTGIAAIFLKDYIGPNGYANLSAQAILFFVFAVCLILFIQDSKGGALVCTIGPIMGGLIHFYDHFRLIPFLILIFASILVFIFFFFATRFVKEKSGSWASVKTN